VKIGDPSGSQSKYIGPGKLERTARNFSGLTPKTLAHNDLCVDRPHDAAPRLVADGSNTA